MSNEGHFELIGADGSDYAYWLDKPETIIGRNIDRCDIFLDDDTVSRRHARVVADDTGFAIADLSSRRGTKVNGVTLSPNILHPLKNGDIVAIANFELHFYLASTPSFIPPDSNKTMKGDFVWSKVAPLSINMRGKKQVTIGRDLSNNIPIDHPLVSRQHAQISLKDGSLVVIDLNSTNGTFVNSKLLKKPYVLKVGDRVRVGPASFLLDADETLSRYDEEGNFRIDAVNLTKVVKDNQTGSDRKLLDDISISVLPREFVVIAGVSGGGKSTLMDALNGFRPATSGIVYVNGFDLYRHYDAYRTELGYVPQQDIVHMELTVEQALDYAAQLRMPADTTKAERKKRINEVLQELKLTERRGIPIEKLSGGQKKRVSIALELLTKPSLFFLDEATSGLDPGTEAEVMNLLRDLAKSGRTVLLITHATENVTTCDLVLFLAKGGRVAYYGPPQQAVAYFARVSEEKIERFSDIYGLVEGEKYPPEFWQETFRESDFYRKYVTDRQREAGLADLPSAQRTAKPIGKNKVDRAFGWRQFSILLQRNLAILLRDRISLGLMLLIAPILGMLDLVTWNRKLFDVTAGDAGQAITMLFNTSLITVMVGALATMREIVKEVDIYKRERAVGLQVMPYIFSKVGFCLLLAIYQSAIFLGFKYLSIDIPGNPFALYFTLLLCAISGTILGLLVSAISPNQNVAPLLTIIAIVPQITFGGGVIPVRTFSLPAQAINYVSLTKWSFESFVTISEIGGDVADDPCWQKSKAERKKLTEKEKKQSCKCLGTPIFQQCRFPGLKSEYDTATRTAVESAEPVKPAQPASPGEVPSDRYAMREYQNKVKQFDLDMDSWKKKMDVWQDDFSKWKEKRESAIAGAESVMTNFYNDYGSMFRVNLVRHWAILCAETVIMLWAISIIQKRKDNF